ncbi:MAG: SDR family NAD(P)-dependent oxidoreductase [Lachnospiraceae bacterium]|nr:SDR family NAD(P)-dependent oxidoreductase [Lachnospiraceae bacterium]
MRKKALITGASRGIGEALAKALAKEGYDLVLVCRRSGEKMNILKEELKARYGIDCRAVLSDVSDPEQVERLFTQTGDVDVLINNAAVSYVGLLTDMSVKEWRQVIDTNLNSLFYTCKYAVPGMVCRKSGKIINVSSVWGNAGASMEVAYSAAKGGVNSFTKALAKELAPSNIQVNAVAFGVIDTEMNACFSEEEKLALREEIPADRLGTAEEAAEMILKVLEAPSYLTGQVITMDGGWI